MAAVVTVGAVSEGEVVGWSYSQGVVTCGALMSPSRATCIHGGGKWRRARLSFSFLGVFWVRNGGVSGRNSGGEGVLIDHAPPSVAIEQKGGEGHIGRRCQVRRVWWPLSDVAVSMGNGKDTRTRTRRSLDGTSSSRKEERAGVVVRNGNGRWNGVLTSCSRRRC